MKYAAHQPNFLPWIGYIAKLSAVDAFVILDDAQMPGGQSYVSRTKIVGPDESGGTWLSVPTASKFGCPINKVRLGIAAEKWKARHLNLVRERYRKRLHFSEIYDEIEYLYKAQFELLIDFNLSLLRWLMQRLKINTPLVMANSLRSESKGDERLADIGRRLEAKHYVSGTGARNYQSISTYSGAGIDLLVMEIPRASALLPNIGYSTLDHLMVCGTDRVREYLSECLPIVESRQDAQ